MRSYPIVKVSDYGRTKGYSGISPRMVKIAYLEILHYCNECDHRYSPVCKYCELDGACPYHGVLFENMDNGDAQCPICGKTFSETWDEYIEETKRRGY